ncbi:hypothetical protein B0H10DRAFT_1968578 [Mycena sp. CBHHK59/15]|nr:hypothetical protein B0H10DRAFT_1968578 [Mycena sp. CBHHK59/15]
MGGGAALSCAEGWPLACGGCGRRGAHGRAGGHFVVLVCTGQEGGGCGGGAQPREGDAPAPAHAAAGATSGPRGARLTPAGTLAITFVAPRTRRCIRRAALRPRGRHARVVARDGRTRGGAPHVGAAVSVSLAAWDGVVAGVRGILCARWRGQAEIQRAGDEWGGGALRGFSFHTLGEDYVALIWRFQFDIDGAKLWVRKEVEVTSRLVPQLNPYPHDAGLGDGVSEGLRSVRHEICHERQKQLGRSPPARRVAEDMRSVEASVPLELDEGNGDFVVLPSVDDVSPRMHADRDNDDALPTTTSRNGEDSRGAGGSQPLEDKDGLDRVSHYRRYRCTIVPVNLMLHSAAELLLPSPQPPSMGDKEKGLESETSSTRTIESFTADDTNEALAAKLWAVYISEAEKYDKALVESWRSDMDGMLIFLTIPQGWSLFREFDGLSYTTNQPEFEFERLYKCFIQIVE